jgi:hypothetical protein
MTTPFVIVAALAALGVLAGRPGTTPAPVDWHVLSRRRATRERFWSALGRLDLPST